MLGCEKQKKMFGFFNPGTVNQMLFDIEFNSNMINQYFGKWFNSIT